MKTLIINASPRKKSTSQMFCHRIQKKTGGEIANLYDSYGDISWLIPKIDEAEVIVFAGPCYINSYPAYVTNLLELLAGNPVVCHGQKVYGVINGGMPYVHTHESGLTHLKLFCKACQMQYMGGFVMGLGPMLDGNELEKHLNAKKYVPAFEFFCDRIKNGEYSPESVYKKAAVKLPPLFARFMAHRMSQSVDKNLISHGFDPKQKSPYL